jgi:hypothetical protein
VPQPAPVATQPVAQPAAQPQPAPVASQAPAQTALTPEQEVAINDLVALTGRSKDDCVLALRAAQGVPDIAYEILASGLPLNQLGHLAAGGGGAEDMDDPYGDEEDEGGSADAGNMPAGANPFAALAANPNFSLIR